MGVHPRDGALYKQALTHSSALAQGDAHGPVDYEPLEFLGDAALGLAAAAHLYEALPDRSPGEYSQLRAHVVNKRSLARVAERLELAPAIRLGKGEELSGGRQRAALLADCVEALIGAVYLDQGWEATSAMVQRLFAEPFEEAVNRPLNWDYKSQLQHLCQARQLALPEFAVVRQEGPDHRKEFEIEVYVEGQAAGRGSGPSKKEAEQQAAREALQRLDAVGG